MKYILGGGIAGLIWAYYNKDYYIVSPEIGGQMKNKFSLGPRYLHDTEISRKFLEDLNYPINKSKIRIGYLGEDGEWVENPDQEYRKKYFMKSRKTNSLDGFDSSVMNSNTKEFGILNVDFEQLIDNISSKIDKNRFITGFVKTVDRENKDLEISDGAGIVKLHYDSLISTMPIKYFSKAVSPKMSIDNKFDSYDMTYVLCKPEAFSFIQNNDFDYVYDLRTETPYHRISREREGYVLDFFGEISQEDLDIYRNIILDYKVLKDAQIISREDIQDLEDVKFVGRYGSWSRKWKTEKVIEEAVKFNE